ncbi:MAG: hypothetical protein NTY38_10445, partial [Acidobacteria bacterium]|nr:hypothetical protein [Acidobacteriota bacterium]
LAWEYLPPLYVDAGFSDMEVPEPFEIRGRHYLLFSNVRSRKSMSGRKDAAGTYYVVSDRPEGPYRLMDDSLLLGSGNGRFDVYVGRTLRVGGERLLYSQTVGGAVSWSTLKVIRQRKDGSLFLAYWHGLDHLVTAARPKQVNDAMITVKVDLRSNKTAAITWRDGCQAVLDGASGVVRIAQAGSPADEIAVAGLGTQPHKVRILLLAQRAEIYLDDRWLFNYRLKGQPAAANVVLAGSARFRDLRVAAIEPLK